MKLTLYDFLRIGHIKRWHNVNTTREQTVAEHSYLVMMIALHLYHELVGVDVNRIDGNSHELVILLVFGMFHDAPEAAGGDTPTPAKRLIRELTGDQDIFKKLDDYLMPMLPYINLPPPRGSVQDFIKCADAIEGYHFIHDNGAGTHAQIVINGSRRRLEDLVENLETEHEGWYAAVNKVLTAMGLPYLHRESRISPP